ncbi:alpha-mannosidase [Streptomyces sp. NBC_01497]|uniref:glycoside hydrolase family 38 N-terminal domain-containing protein n=1 Tax=Streptomyces sp. NBC_01497 TaxID=2903885 RepID=UPI002E33ADE9|nr:alpha-mannosidase [Streptomyces sp. NBC_01497]
MDSDLTRPSWWDSNLARDLLRENAVAHTHRLGATTVRFSQEPLLRRRGDGLLQSLRVDTEPAVPQALAGAVVRTRGGAVLDCETAPGPEGSARLLVPEVPAATELTVELPVLAPGATVALTLTPQRHWTVHLVQHAHLDLGYTDPQGVVLAEARAALDTCLELMRATDDWPEEARYRWSVEGLSTFEDWAAHRPPHQVAEFVRRVREGRAELTAMPFNLHSETCSVDELHEALRGVATVRERYGLTIGTAMQTDVPGQVVGFPDALADHGVRRLSVAHNWAGRAVPHLVGGAALPRLFRWRTADGRTVLVWRTDTPHGLAYMEGSIIGFDESYPRVDDLLPAYLTSLATRPYPHDGKGIPGFPILDEPFRRDPYPWDVLHLRVLGTFADNGPPRLVAAATVRDWNETWAYPRLRLSRHEDFFADAEQRLGDGLETHEGDWNDWWADGVGAGAAPMAMNRAAQAAITDAQTLDTLATTAAAPAVPATRATEPATGAAPGSGAAAASDAAPASGAAADEAMPGLAPGPVAGVYRTVSLFNEHTWGAGDPWTYGCQGHGSGEQQWHWKYGQAAGAKDGALTLLEQAGHRLGAVLPAGPPGALASFHVVNTRSSERTDVVRFFLPESAAAVHLPVEVTDGRTGKPLPLTGEAQVNVRHRAAGRFLHVTVAQVPPLGTVRLDIRPAAAPLPPGTDGYGARELDVLDRESTVLENEYLTVRVDPRSARVASVTDRATGTELVSQDAVFGFNAYVYDRYATAGGFNHQSSKTVANDSMHLLASRAVAPAAVLLSRTSSPVAETLVYECVPDGADRLRVTLTLPHGVPRLDITNRLTKPATLTKESAFFAFPFALGDPLVRMEATGGVVGTGLPTVPGGAPHMRAMRRWATLAEGGTRVGWATHDAPLVQRGTLAVPYVPYPSSLSRTEPGTLYSWVHNNIWDTNFPSSQAFEQEFRYSIAVPEPDEGTPASDAALGMRAAANGHPLLAVRATGGAADEGTGAAVTSWLTLDHPGVRVVGLTTPRPGTALVRLQSFADAPADVALHVHVPFSTARTATYLAGPGEELLPGPDGSLRVPLAARGTAAVLLTLPVG